MIIRQWAVEQWSVSVRQRLHSAQSSGLCRQRIACRTIVELQWGWHQSWLVSGEKCRKDRPGEARLRAGFSWWEAPPGASEVVWSWGAGRGAEGWGVGVPLPTGGGFWGHCGCPPPQIFFIILWLVYKWLVLVHSETNFYTGRRAIEFEII